MDINIVTITGESNYGNSLQNYAVIKTLESLGNNVFTLKTQYEPRFTVFSRNNLKQYIKVLFKRSNYFCFIRKFKFHIFSNKYLNKTKYVVNENKPELSKKCDLLVFGSDQIWNFTWGGRLCEGIDFYSGGFAPDIPKIAYSASIGASYIPDEKKEKFSQNLSGFKCISVREEQAKDILSELIDNKTTVTIDPTIMLSKNDWDKIAKKPSYINKNEKFILTYFLGEKSNEVKDYIKEFSEKNSFRIINLYNEYEDYNNIASVNDYCVDPREYIWLIKHSQIVFTDSFHGSVFSIIFHKNFRCFQRSKNIESMSSRMDTLFSTMKTSDWCNGDVNETFESLTKYDYKDVDTIIKEKRDFAKSYLKYALSIIND